MVKEKNSDLEKRLTAAVAGLSPKSTKKMFGCHAVFAGDKIFAMVWKEGRIVFKLPEPKAFETLMSEKGAAPWSPRPSVKTKWVMVPESFHGKPKKLEQWAEIAFSLCGKMEQKATSRTRPKG